MRAVGDKANASCELLQLRSKEWLLRVVCASSDAPLRTAGAIELRLQGVAPACRRSANASCRSSLLRLQRR
jgi:hypothetical protein